MSEQTTTYQQALTLVMSLSEQERLALVEHIIAAFKEKLPAESAQKPRRSLRGLLAEFGPAPSAEDIAEVRREMLANFPREDIA